MLHCMQIKRPGAVAVARAVCKSGKIFKALSLDENEISENGIDSLKVRTVFK